MCTQSEVRVVIITFLFAFTLLYAPSMQLKNKQGKDIKPRQLTRSISYAKMTEQQYWNV